MNKYHNTVIYKLICKDTRVKDIYIGQTTNLLNRIKQHKTDCMNEKNKKVYDKLRYKTIRENGGFDNWEFIEIKTICCENKAEAEAEEQKVIIEYKANLNDAISGRPKGAPNLTPKYNVYYFNFDTNEYNLLGNFNSFIDMETHFKNIGIDNLNRQVLERIYKGKTKNNNLLRITNI